MLLPTSAHPFRKINFAVVDVCGPSTPQLSSRWTRFLSLTVPFVTRLIRDYTAGNILKNEGELARDFRIVIEKLGPTFIKVWNHCTKGGTVDDIHPHLARREAPLLDQSYV